MSPLDVPSRIPPHNLDAERAVLGAVLLEGREALPRVVEVLRPSDFYTEAHRAIYQAMLTLFDRGAPVDALTLSEELRRTDQIQFVGGPAAIALLMEEASIAAHLGSYTSIVRDMAVLRELIQTSTQIITQAFDAKDEVQTLVDDAEKRIFSLAERRLEGSALPVGKILKNTFEYIERLYERKEHVTGVATGFEKLDLETSGFQPSDFIIIAGRPSMGKAQPLDAAVRTDAGWKRMGELRVGDALASLDGRPSRVAGIFPQGERQVYRVTFSDGRSTECCAEHLWRVHHRGWRQPRVMTTGRVGRLLTRTRYRHRLWIDVVAGVAAGKDDALPLDPWLLGALLRDGQLGGSGVTSATADVGRVHAHAEARFARQAAGGYDRRVHGAAHQRTVSASSASPIMEALRGLGLGDLGTEAAFVPRVYLDASRAARLDLLRGLMGPGGAGRDGARFCSTRERLAHDVAELVRSLGGWCSIRRRTVAVRDASGTTSARPVFECRIRGAAPGTIVRPVFVSIEPTRVAPTQCIAVTHPSRLYVTDDYIVTHNTAFALNIAQHVGVTLRGTVLVLSLEMSAQQLVQRMLCSEAKVDAQAVRTGFLSSSDWHRLTAAAGRLSEAKIFIDDSPGVTVLEARAKARRMKAEHGLDMLVVDYLQLMRGRAALDNRQQEISEISRSLKALAKELNIPVVALSQLSRAVEARAQRDFRPQLSDLRECVAGETLVLLADGRRVPIRHLVDTAPEVLAMSEAGKIITAKTDRVWRVGHRAVLKVTLASGREIRATADHRLYSGRGWLMVRQLRVDDRLALARKLPEPAITDTWPDQRIALLGQLIGDGVNGWLRELGIVGQPSHQKRVPESVFQLSDRQIALLLRHLWATDGTIAPRRTGRGGHNVFYATNSPGLAMDVAALLLRMGIVARTTKTRKAAYRPVFHVAVSGTDHQRRFLETVGAFGPRVPQAQRLQALLADRHPNTNVDTLPAEVFDHVRSAMGARGVSHRRMAALRNTAYGGTARSNFAPTSDLFWDRVVSIADDGEDDVFDLTVPGVASWLADGIVSHNSGALEQDADVILFLYRAKVYKDDVPPDEENIAEVIIGKQRNGPIGTIKVVFLPQYARFENAADFHRQTAGPF